jgi:hydrocephalus-inducing protein
VLKNEGQVPATVRFDAITNEAFSFEGASMTHTIMSKANHAFDFKFNPKKAANEKFAVTFQTQNNPYEQHRCILVGEAYTEPVTFENLPQGREDSLHIGDCTIGQAKAVNFNIVNSGSEDVKFRWNAGAPERDEFTFYPSVGHLKACSQKQVKVMVRGKETKKYESIDFVCETWTISQQEQWQEWDDTMKTLKLIRPSEQKKLLRDREVAEIKRKEE